MLCTRWFILSIDMLKIWEGRGFSEWPSPSTKNMKITWKSLWRMAKYMVCCNMFSFSVWICRVCYVKVSSSQSYVTSLSYQDRTCTRSWWRRRCRYVSMHATWLQTYTLINDSANSLLQNILPCNLFHSLPHGVLVTIRLLSWIHTCWHTMHT